MLAAKDLLLSHDEYQKNQYRVPYTYTISHNGQYLYYFGARHSFDPEHPQFPKLKMFWQDFLEETQKKNCLVLNEGGKRPLHPNEWLAISTGAEAGLITFLASKENIKTCSPEPSKKDEIGEWLNVYTKEEIEYYFFSRAICQWHRLLPQPDFNNYISRPLLKHAKELGWKGFDFSLEHMKEIHKRLFRGNFNENDKQFFECIATPVYRTTIISQISNDLDINRNSYIVNKIKWFWHSGKSLFVVYGSGHAIVQEPALRKLLTTE